MSIVNDKINQIKEVKENIKTALINKGVNMDSVVFTAYPSKINRLTINYGGYTLSHGSMTLAGIISAGYIPLIALLYEGKFDVNTTAGTGRTATIVSSSGGNKTFNVFTNTATSDSGKSAIYKSNCNAYLDLMHLYSFNLDDVKNITAINGLFDSVSIVQWLIPNDLLTETGWMLDAGNATLITQSINGWDATGSSVASSNTYTFTELEKPKMLSGSFNGTNVSGNDSHSYTYYISINYADGTNAKVVSGSGEVAHSTGYSKPFEIDLEANGFDIDNIVSVTMYHNGGYQTKNNTLYAQMYRKQVAE